MSLQVKEGWGPLCKFLGVPEPSTPFPRVNDTAEIMKARKIMVVLSWMVIVIIPLVLAGLALVNSWDLRLVAAIYFGVMMILKLSSLKLSSSSNLFNKKKKS